MLSFSVEISAKPYNSWDKENTEGQIDINIIRIFDIRGLLEKYPTFGREKETGSPGALDT